jgi:hypothetical protein
VSSSGSRARSLNQRSSRRANRLIFSERSNDEKAWHGPNLKGSIRRVGAPAADWRPRPGRRSIAEIVVHAAYWKYAARRRLRGDKRGSFALKGSNWFALPTPLTDEGWRGFVRLLESEHRALRAAVAELPPDRLPQVPAGGKFSNAALILGIASHDLYHAGQIQLLKRLHAQG